MRGAQLVAICDNDGPKAGALAQRLGVPDIFTDIDELLDTDKLDAVVIATPNHLHEPHVLRALKQKVHVLCERPLSLTRVGVRGFWKQQNPPAAKSSSETTTASAATCSSSAASSREASSARSSQCARDSISSARASRDGDSERQKQAAARSWNTDIRCSIFVSGSLISRSPSE